MGSILVLTLFVSFAMYVMYLGASTFKQGSDVLHKEIDELNESCDKIKGELIGFETEDLSLISTHLQNYNFKKGMRYNQFSGSITTIYHETIANFFGKIFNATNRKVVIFVAKTNKTNYAFKFNSKEVEVSTDGHFVGTIIRGYKFIPANSSTPIAEIQQQMNDYKFIINNKNVATLSASLLNAESTTARAFQLFQLEGKEDNDLFLMLFIYFIVDQKVKL